ncbi:MAG: VCBS repeat-containing protein, partial [Pirellulales bacterium]
MKNVWGLIALTHLFVATTANAAEKVSFERFEIDPLFRSEGVATADLNRDGKRDIVVGDLWYAAPDWKPHEIRNPRKPNRGGYTEAFAVYTDDFNGDEWADVLVVPFHGKDAKWYENPKNKDGHWTERVAFKGTGNETRLYTDSLFPGK